MPGTTDQNYPGQGASENLYNFIGIAHQMERTMEKKGTLYNRLRSSFIPILVLGALLISGCGGYRTLSGDKLEKQYTAAVADAAFPEEKEISRNLLEVRSGNRGMQWRDIQGEEHILVATWTANVSYYPDKGAYNTGEYPIWVTLVPELRNKAREIRLEKFEDRSLRIKQLLGLPAKVEKNYFMEIWVKPRDLFRPCPDPGITDRECQLCFPSDINEQHRDWIQELRLSSYYNCNGDKYPWTQLGYTYDWNKNSRDHVGLSEFVVSKNSDIQIERVVATEQYLDEIVPEEQ